MTAILLINHWKVIWKSTVSYCFLVSLRFCVFVRVVTLPAYRFVSNGTRLGMDGLLTMAPSCRSVLLQFLGMFSLAVA